MCPELYKIIYIFIRLTKTIMLAQYKSFTLNSLCSTTWVSIPTLTGNLYTSSPSSMCITFSTPIPWPFSHAANNTTLSTQIHSYIMCICVIQVFYGCMCASSLFAAVRVSKSIASFHSQHLFTWVFQCAKSLKFAARSWNCGKFN